MTSRYSELPTESGLDIARLSAALPELRARYTVAEPFPHVVLDEFLDPSIAERAAEEFPPIDPERWINYLHVNERKYGNTNPRTWGPTLQGVAEGLTSAPFVHFLEELTGIDALLVDDTFEGGGLHQSVAGGFLNVHADFTVHPQHRHWRRRVNVLVYLNDEWPAAYSGDLELWSTDMKRCVKTIAPIGNRAVVFTTDADSFHGHPDPLRCPPGVARQSMALYYFTAEDEPTVRSTEYRARPGDGPRSALIYLDKQVVRNYDRIKRRLGLSDDFASRFLNRLQRLRPRRKR